MHNAGLRMIIGAYHSSPIPCTHNFTGIPPLKIRRHKLTLNYEFKLTRTLISISKSYA